MRFEKIQPPDILVPYVRHFVISEEAEEKRYTVLPSTHLVIGFQYKGNLSQVADGVISDLSRAGISGIADRFKVFRNVAGTGTILVFFTEMGIAHFSSCPANELFNQSVSLDLLFEKWRIAETEEKLSEASTDLQRIRIIEKFLIANLRQIDQDKLVMEAVRRIYQSKGALKMKELTTSLYISQSPFEKRFRKLVGTSPKKFSSIVRFNAVLKSMGQEKSLLSICHENGFFDQAHFIKDFRQYTGQTPEEYKRLL